MKKAFTLIELTIVMIVIGILSVLLFRTISQMIHTNARIQQEKILSQELIAIQTALNNISEHYPYINREFYKANFPQDGIVSTLSLKNSSGDSITLVGSGDCSEICGLIAQNKEEEIAISNSQLTLFSGIVFKILPTQYYEKTQYEDTIKRENISQPGFWIFGQLTNNLANKDKPKTSYILQSFINLKLDDLHE